MAAADTLLLILSIFAGFLLIFAGVALLLADSRGRAGSEAKGWGVILIGPVPIILRGRGVRVAAIVAALFLLTVLLFLWLAGVVSLGP
ncbi:MAG: DUF131 domain-containing protein [Nitrososphaerota archaeon]